MLQRLRPAWRLTSSAPKSRFSTARLSCTEDGLFVDRSLPPNFDKILIANRGEIACRVIRTCKHLGIRTVAVHSDADAKALHVQMADEAYRIGEAPATESYLKGDTIIDVAKRSGAQAIHPGYGFLSENEHFARAIETAGLSWIGPPASAINSMGSKSASKIIMEGAGVPCVPGYHGEDQSIERLTSEARKIGFPLMIKAVLGGGGKGMRISHSEQDFNDMLDACVRESKNSFDDDRVLLERYIQRPRHIEFQVFCDNHNNAVHLHERDCSVQRRHQKVLEEAPAPGMSEELRAAMGQSAVSAALAVGYQGAGTVEFIFDAETNDYFFMEMNTRLQVEHPVTEMLVGRDLVQWQLHVAANHHLPATQSEVSANVSGHAIEARIYAENPGNNFLPATGRLNYVSPPASSDRLRVETGIRSGDEVSIFYDPMIAKLVVWAEDRETCLKDVSTSLEDYNIAGLPTNISFLQRAVNHPAFHKGQVETGFIPEFEADLLPVEAAPSTHAIAAASLCLMSRGKPQTSNDPWSSPTGYRVNAELERNACLHHSYYQGGEAHSVPIDIAITYLHNPNDTAQTFAFRVGDQTSQVSCVLTGDSKYAVSVDGVTRRVSVVSYGTNIDVFIDGCHTLFTRPQVEYGRGEHSSGCVAPMSGKVVKVVVEPGQTVKQGAPLVIMEAMKMEHVIKAPADGVVAEVLYSVGSFVDGGKVMVTFEASEETEEAE